MQEIYLTHLLSRQKFIELYGKNHTDLDFGALKTLSSAVSPDAIVDNVLYLQDPLTKSSGGCILRNNLPELSKDFVFDNAIFVSNVFFHLDGDSEIHDDVEQFHSLMRSFYNDLKKNVIKHAFKDGVMILLSPEDYEDTRIFGDWNYTESVLIENKYVLSQLDLSN